MPRFNDDIMEEQNIPNTSFGYSATRIDELSATEYTLVDLVVDTSGSVDDYKSDIEKAIKEVVNACKLSPRADNLMIRFSTFNFEIDEVHGYKLLENCNLADYEGILKCGGMTALYDASEIAILSQIDYARNLTENDFSVNSIVVIFTDGMHNHGSCTIKSVEKALNGAVKSEATESMISILIGVGVANDYVVSDSLKLFKDGANISQYVETQDASAKTLAKLAQFVSKSVSAQSQALGSGGPSKLLSLSI